MGEDSSMGIYLSCIWFVKWAHCVPVGKREWYGGLVVILPERDPCKVIGEDGVVSWELVYGVLCRGLD